MSPFAVILCLHILANLALFAALCFELFQSQRTLRLRLITSGSLFVLLLTGGYLTAQVNAWTLAWPKVAVGGLVLYGALSGLASRPALLKPSFGLRMGLVPGFVLLMTAKPALPAALAILIVSAVLGWAATGVTSASR